MTFQILVDWHYYIMRIIKYLTDIKVWTLFIGKQRKFLTKIIQRQFFEGVLKNVSGFTMLVAHICLEEQLQMRNSDKTSYEFSLVKLSHHASTTGMKEVGRLWMTPFSLSLFRKNVFLCLKNTNFNLHIISF